MRVLGVDYGARRIGLALSDASGTLARPWKAVARTGNPSQVAQQLLAELTILERQEEGVSTIVLGYPRRLSGDPTDQTSIVEAIAERLRALTDIPVVLQDERLSSHEAEAVLARAEKDWRKRKAQLDAMAAAVILQDFLDGGGGSPAPAEESES